MIKITYKLSLLLMVSITVLTGCSTRVHNTEYINNDTITTTVTTTEQDHIASVDTTKNTAPVIDISTIEQEATDNVDMSTSTKREIPEDKQVPLPEQKSSETENIPITDTITLIISGTRYTLPYSENISVEDVMHIAQTQSLITFETKQYTGMGTFITAIQGKKQDVKNGYYWIYSINGKKATSGISTTIIHTGDIIEWTYETSTI